MKRIAITAALAALALSAGGELTPAQAQQVIIAPQPYAYSYAPGATTYYPTNSYVVAQPYRNRGVLPGFSRRGGIGTTPYLGNTGGLGAYSTNYSAPGGRRMNYVYPAQAYAVYPGQVYAYPGRRGW